MIVDFPTKKQIETREEQKQRLLDQLDAIAQGCVDNSRELKDKKTEAHFKAKDRL